MRIGKLYISICWNPEAKAQTNMELDSSSFAKGLADAGYKINWLELARRQERLTGWGPNEDIFESL
jgi:hypothetical protein